MANRTFYPAMSYGSSRVYLEFRFTAPGAGTSVAAAAIDGADAVASIAHVAGTNKLSITLKDSFNRVIDLDVDVLEGAVGNGGYATAGNITNENTASGIKFDVYTWAAAGSAANDSTGVIACRLALRNGNWGTK